ncbi:MAG TPA: cytidylate kinase [Erysipelotrichaceae bacterium]|nr:cytidylate kinase [Erysipelotrichaceae bacterium]
MSGKIITISRQFGSGGRTIGKKLAAELGIPCYDSEIIAEIAKKSGFDQDYVRENSEYTSETGLFAALSGVDFYGHSNRDEIWITQCRVIRELAEEGPCVIIGRCADYVLKEDHDLLKVFIYSDMESRAKRIVEQYGESNVNPEKRLKDKDKRRAAYYELYTDQKFGDFNNYDLCLNSGTIGLDKCVDIIRQIYQK